MSDTVSFKKDSEIDIRDGDEGGSIFAFTSSGGLKTLKIRSTLFTPVGVMMSCKKKQTNSKVRNSH